MGHPRVDVGKRSIRGWGSLLPQRARLIAVSLVAVLAIGGVAFAAWAAAPSGSDSCPAPSRPVASSSVLTHAEPATSGCGVLPAQSSNGWDGWEYQPTDLMPSGSGGP